MRGQRHATGDACVGGRARAALADTVVRRGDTPAGAHRCRWSFPRELAAQMRAAAASRPSSSRRCSPPSRPTRHSSNSNSRPRSASMPPGRPCNSCAAARRLGPFVDRLQSLDASLSEQRRVRPNSSRRTVRNAARGARTPSRPRPTSGEWGRRRPPPPPAGHRGRAVPRQSGPGIRQRPPSRPAATATAVARSATVRRPATRAGRPHRRRGRLQSVPTQGRGGVPGGNRRRSPVGRTCPRRQYASQHSRALRVTQRPPRRQRGSQETPPTAIRAAPRPARGARSRASR